MGASRLSSTPLPGIGVRHDLTTREQRRLSVVAHRDGSRTLSAYREDDPDACDLGLMAERIELSATAHWNGRLLGETRMRTETGVSIVAVLRRAEAIPSPTPDSGLSGGDTLILIGTREGVEAAAALLGRE